MRAEVAAKVEKSTQEAQGVGESVSPLFVLVREHYNAQMQRRADRGPLAHAQCMQ